MCVIESQGKNNAKYTKENMAQTAIYTVSIFIFFTCWVKKTKTKFKLGEKNLTTIELENMNYFSSKTVTTGQIYNLLPPDGRERQVQMSITVHHFNWLISQTCASLKLGNRSIQVLDFFLLLLVCLCPKCLADFYSPLLLLFHLTMCSFWLILLYGQDQFSPLFIP